MAENGVRGLRHEFPALALVTGFIHHSRRFVFADLLLLWIEGRRAASANEGMIAAVRLAWWRDAIKDQNTHGVPLAERLISHHNKGRLELSPFITTLDQMISDLAGGGAGHQALTLWHNIIGERLAETLTVKTDADMAAQILMAFDDSQHPIPPLVPQMALPFRLMQWLLSDPARSAYPAEKPWLALQMMVSVFLRRI